MKEKYNIPDDVDWIEFELKTKSFGAIIKKYKVNEIPDFHKNIKVKVIGYGKN